MVTNANHSLEHFDGMTAWKFALVMHIYYTKIRKMHVFFDGNAVSDAVDGKLSCPCHEKVKKSQWKIEKPEGELHLR